jgi:murein DD-endopeptidase MepM/ murein hydrolase activator NlpD
MMRRLASAILAAALLAGCAPEMIARPQITAAPTFAPTALPAFAAPNPAVTLSLLPSLVPPATALPSPAPNLAGEDPTCGVGWCAYAGHFLLARPIASPYGDGVDPTYRYASTDGGLHVPHTGVEFQAPFGEPVWAAGDGQVVQAGEDLTAPFTGLGDEYGNLVIIRHSFAAYPDPVYSFYGHLSQVDVRVGDAVKTGQVIGRVGETGIATGPHLHFEVRVGKARLPGTANPELWLLSAVPSAQPPGGAIAGRVAAANGSPLLSLSIVLQRQAEAGSAKPLPVYLQTYDTAQLPSDAVWNEDFAAGDLRPGVYRVSVVANGQMHIREVTIFSNRVSLVTFEPNPTPTLANGE